MYAMTEEQLYETEVLENALAYRVHRLARMLSVALRRDLHELGHAMSLEQYFVFFRIHANEGCSQSALIDPYLKDAPNITRLVDGLVSKELVERRQDPDDRRAHALHLTDQGRKLWLALRPRIEAERRVLYRGLSLADAKRFLATIATLETNAVTMSDRGTSK